MLPVMKICKADKITAVIKKIMGKRGRKQVAFSLIVNIY